MCLEQFFPTCFHLPVSPQRCDAFTEHICNYLFIKMLRFPPITRSVPLDGLWIVAPDNPSRFGPYASSIWLMLRINPFIFPHSNCCPQLFCYFFPALFINHFASNHRPSLFYSYYGPSFYFGNLFVFATPQYFCPRLFIFHCEFSSNPPV